MRNRNRWGWVGVAVVVGLLGGGVPALGGEPGGGYEPPRFADPERREKLMAALAEIDAQFVSYLERDHVPGAAWGVLIDGELVHSGSHGVRELESGTAVDMDTVFRIASMTKSFTALAILKLRDAGKLGLDDPAERYVPELRALAYPTADSPRITIRHLLSHEAGFPEDNPWGDQQLAISEEAMTALLKQGLSFSNPPGQGYEYSNFGYAILGRIVAVVAGMPYARYLDQAILQPLGMTATTMEPAAVPPNRLAVGYRHEDGVWKLEPALADGAFGPMGGMLTSMRDLSRYVGFLMDAWPARDGPDTGPVRRASVREMQQVARMRPASATATAGGGVRLQAGGYGFGLRVNQSEQFSQVVGHAGGLPGYGSLMLWLPEHGVGLIAAGNRTYTRWGPRFDAAFSALATTGALQPRVPQPAPALIAARELVSRLIVHWDDALADELAADNLFKDRSKGHRRRELEALRARHGQFRTEPGAELHVENALRGHWLMAGERGTIRVQVTLAPTVPPRVQHLEVETAELP